MTRSVLSCLAMQVWATGSIVGPPVLPRRTQVSDFRAVNVLPLKLETGQRVKCTPEAYKQPPVANTNNVSVLIRFPFHYAFGRGAEIPLKAGWVKGVVEMDPNPNKVIVSIGCNIGDNLLEWIKLWDRTAKPVNPTAWSRNLKRILYRKPLRKSSRISPMGDVVMAPDAYCVEPLPVNVDILTRTSKALGYDGPHGGQKSAVNIVPEAFSASTDETAYFPINTFQGREDFGIQRNATLQGEGAMKKVRVNTVDNFMKERNLKTIDVLFIDAEGFDPLVLEGARQSLRERRVRIVEFEVHTVRQWASTKVKDVVDMLDNYGYECFYMYSERKPEPEHLLSRVTGCWRDVYETEEYKFWTNMVCVNRFDEWREVFMKHDRLVPFLEVR